MMRRPIVITMLVTAAAAATTACDTGSAADAAAKLTRLRSFIVVRHGDIVREQYYRGATRDTRANVKSASKSVISALAGIAIAEGKLTGLDQRVALFFPSYMPTNPDPRLSRLTIGNLLSMQAGLEPTSFGDYGAWVSSGNWVRNALQRSFVDDPGGRMLYSTGSSHIMSAILTKATGMSTLAYARARLFRPLGIELSPWATDPQGVYFGGNEMRLRPRDLLTFAELYRNEGRHNGVQIVPAAWVRDSWVQRTTSPYNGHGYGLGWWMRERGGHAVYFAWGYGGQYAFIVPDLGITVVMTSDGEAPREGDHNRALHALISDYIIPAAERGAAERGAASGVRSSRAPPSGADR